MVANALTSDSICKSLRVAIIHDWLVSQRGGENVLDAICELFPQAHLYCLVHVPGSTASHIEQLHPRTSFLQKIPGATKRYRHLLPLMPLAIESLDMRGYDLILSSSHCVAKGVRKDPTAVHVSYVHAPMRYMWDRFSEYFSKQRSGFVTRLGAHLFRPYLQWWDRRSATRVDRFLSNSQFISSRIQDIYKRPSTVVYPFCDVDRFSAPRKPGAEYLMVTALVPYKRVDLAIEAFRQSGRSLVIVGDGPDRQRLEGIAGSTVRFLGSQEPEAIAQLYSVCRGLVFPGVEDFGIVPIEAMSAGMPVLAFGQGGVLETVVEGRTGLFFKEPTLESLMAALNQFETMNFSEGACRERGRQFTREKFQSEYLREVQMALKSSHL